MDDKFIENKSTEITDTHETSAHSSNEAEVTTEKVKITKKNNLTVTQKNIIYLGCAIIFFIILFFCIFFGFKSHFINKYRTVDNSISLTLTGIERISNLRVLTVAGTTIESARDSDNKIDAVYQFYGHANYVINLKESDFSVDTKNNAIFVQLPNAEFSGLTLDSHMTHEVYFNNSYGNDSDVDGQILGHILSTNAYNRLNEKLNSNRYREIANENAKQIISKFIKNLNPDFPDLEVIFR